MSTATPTRQQTTPTLQEQAQKVLMPLAAGYVGHRTIAIGLRQGLLEALAERPEGMTPAELASACDFDEFYVSVWCRAALAAGVLEDDGDERYHLGPHMDTLLLDVSSPAHAGPTFRILEQPEMFDWFEQRLPTGQRTWWDEASPAFIENVGDTGRPFYTRLVPGALREIPGLEARLAEDARILDTACGAGVGVVRLAETYPDATVVGADGDQHSLELARRRAEEAGVGDRVGFIHTPLEELDPDEKFALVINNISMHECRDIDQVTANVHEALEPGGWFVISDLPFPDSTEQLQTVPGLVMSGIQYWEAQIGDQLLPRDVYDDLLSRHGFRDIDSFAINPTHAVTYARA